LLPTPDAIRLETALNHFAKTRSEADRAEAAFHGDQDRVFTTIEQLRADGLSALANNYLADPERFRAGMGDVEDFAPRPGAITIKPVVQVTVGLSTLIGADDQPGELAGYGPIPASLARLIAGDPNSTWFRLVTDPLGRPIDYGLDKYKPPTNLDRFIRANYSCCAYPTCSRAAVTCEIDHVRARADGGPTNSENLIPLCSRHHHLKHEAGWTIQHDPVTVTTTWTTPRGRTYTNIADPLPGTDPEPEVADPLAGADLHPCLELPPIDP
jgi:hypothetical protein